MANKLSKKRFTEFVKFIKKYYDENPDKLEKLGYRYNGNYDQTATSTYMTSIASIAISMLHEYKFNEETYKDFCDGIKNLDYQKCVEICEYLHENAFFAATVEWTNHPKLLSRHFLISARCNLSDIMYAIIAAFRCSGTHLFTLVHHNVSFEPFCNILRNGLHHYSEMADNYGIILLSDTAVKKFHYDFSEDWEFTIRLRKPVVLKENPNTPNVILQKGVGYGIFEDNKALLEMFIENPEQLVDGDIKVKDIIPFDFYDADIDSLKESFNNDFNNIRADYNDFSDVDLVKLFEEENEDEEDEILDDIKNDDESNKYVS